MPAWLWTIYLAAVIAVTAYLLILAVRNSRRLTERIEALHEELEENSAPLNPYEALAELYAESDRKDKPDPMGR